MLRTPPPNSSCVEWVRQVAASERRAILRACVERGGRIYAGFPISYAPSFMVVNFDERRPSHYQLFNVKNVLPHGSV